MDRHVHNDNCVTTDTFKKSTVEGIGIIPIKGKMVRGEGVVFTEDVVKLVVKCLFSHQVTCA